MEINTSEMIEKIKKEWESAESGFSAGVDYKSWLEKEVIALRIEIELLRNFINPQQQS
jgi:hypothetical protein